MNIAHVITTIDRGGAEQQLLTLVREQLSINKSVNVYVLKGSMSLLEEFKTLGAVVETLSSKSFWSETNSSIEESPENSFT